MKVVFSIINIESGIRINHYSYVICRFEFRWCLHASLWFFHATYALPGVFATYLRYAIFLVQIASQEVSQVYCNATIYDLHHQLLAISEVLVSSFFWFGGPNRSVHVVPSRIVTIFALVTQ